MRLRRPGWRNRWLTVTMLALGGVAGGVALAADPVPVPRPVRPPSAPAAPAPTPVPSPAAPASLPAPVPSPSPAVRASKPPVSPGVVPASATVAAAAVTTEATALAETLQRQDEMIQQLAEQNRQLSEQLEAVTRRLDSLNTQQPGTPPLPAPSMNVEDGVDFPASEAEARSPVGEGAPGGMPRVLPPGVNLDVEEGVDFPASEAEARPPRGEGIGGGSTIPSARAMNEKGLVDSLHLDDDYGLKSLFDSMHPRNPKGEPWYDKLGIRGYAQVRFGRGMGQDPFGGDPYLFGDRTINGKEENFLIRRARMIVFGDISEHLYLYFQQDFANPPPGSRTGTYYGQIRDLYGDVYIDTERVHRLRVGQSKVPYGWEVMQSSQNRIPLDRSVAIDSGVSPNQRDVGVFYYWTPVAKQRLLSQLVSGGLKGSGNYGIFGLGVYNGQGGSELEHDLNLNTVARFTWPFRLDSGQAVELSLQGFHGHYVPRGAAISPLGQGPPVVPANATTSLEDQRMAATFVWYPQPWGFQAEWNVGRGPGLNDQQTGVDVRALHGGYAMTMYKLETERFGIFTPYLRYQYYLGGYRTLPNAPFGTHGEWDLGVEWQIRREMELTATYSFVDGLNPNPISEADVLSYRNFVGGVLRFQFQINY